jgi:hypothetical protein
VGKGICVADETSLAYAVVNVVGDIAQILHERRESPRIPQRAIRTRCVSQVVTPCSHDLGEDIKNRESLSRNMKLG